MSSARRLLFALFVVATTAFVGCGLGPKQDDPGAPTSFDGSTDAFGTPPDGGAVDVATPNDSTAGADTPAGPFDNCGDGGDADVGCEAGDAANDGDATDADAIDAPTDAGGEGG